MALTDAEVTLIRNALKETTDFRVFPLLVETVLWAIFTVLVCTSSYILVARGLESSAKRWMLAATLIMYGLSTLDWAIDIVHVWTDLKISLPEDLLSPAQDQSRIDTMNVILRIIQAITNNICAVIGDIVLCWRVIVVYRWDRRVVLTAVILLLVLFGTIFTCNLTQIGIGFPDIANLHRLAPTQLYIDIVALSCTSIINAWATAMVALRAWKSRREIREHLATSDRRSFTESVLILLLEIGIVYTALWICKNVIVIPGLAKSSYTNYAIFVMNQVVGMYPTLILVLVALQRSHVENHFSYSKDTGPMRFADAIASAQNSSRTDSTVAGDIISISVRRTRQKTSDIPYETSSMTVSSESLKDEPGRVSAMHGGNEGRFQVL